MRTHATCPGAMKERAFIYMNVVDATTASGLVRLTQQPRPRSVRRES